MNKQISELTDLELAEVGMQLQAQLVTIQQEIQKRKEAIKVVEEVKKKE